MSMFSGLEVQSEIDRLLDELFGHPGETAQGEAGGQKRHTLRQETKHLRVAQGQPEKSWSFGTGIGVVPGQGPWKPTLVP